MRALISLVVAVPLMLSARSVWACDDNDTDDGPQDPYIQRAFDQDFDIDIHWDIDVRWGDHNPDDRQAASEMIHDRLQDLEERLDSSFDNSSDDSDDSSDSDDNDDD